MGELGMLSACELREQFKAIPAELRDANQAFSIRVWRGLSWLERAEAAGDVEGRFISLWIAFNAIYGHLSPREIPSATSARLTARCRRH